MAKNGTKNGAADFSPIVEDVMEHIGKELADAIPELNEAVQFGDGEGSFSVTLQIKRGKKNRFTATLKSRVRSPRPPIEIDMHLENGQLRLGYDEAKHGKEDGPKTGAHGAGASPPQ